MKHFLLAISILTLSSSESAAQWMNADFDFPVAFGAHDTSFFGSESDGSVYRLEPTQVEADSGILSGSSILSFDSIGVYLMASGYRSSDNGSHWIPTNMPLLPTCFATIGGYLYAGGYNGFQGGGVCRSGDNGMNWIQMDSGLTDLNVNALVVSGTNMFAGTKFSGIYRSTDGGSNWTSTNMKTATSALAVVGTIIIAASDGSGMFRSTDGGANWTQDDSGLFNFAVNSIVTDGKNLFAGTGLKSGAPNGDFDEGSGVFLSTDSGATWDTVNYGLPQGTFNGADDYLSVNALGLFDTLLFVGVWDGAGENNRTYVRSIKEILKKDTTSGVVQQIPQADSIEIYPNPATGMVTIAGNTPILSIRTLNVLGEELLDYSNTYSSNVTFDLSKFPSGTYFVEIQTAKGTVLRKIIRE